eukprot:CAMPEP_0197629284 /NCGR_PEP_ID=MMETSP1338-20131121/7203_1 /TAXON_ID=43686 ORGANISM="Pelagodinium beii, Strain RCC1491" /NCGR_SAMPLE_ID=MMETSP1338 /ASSEMBLY_ACC=CAM_ASM_000754 /LENGTH=489 /DNA_ID=CAMNT_0043200313 /DNA_START=315 /DNA_END=1784 /DNA_ORIENTATION=-
MASVVANMQGDEPSQMDLVVRSIGGYARAAKWLAPYIPLYLATESAASRGEDWDPEGSLAKEWEDQHGQSARDLSEIIQEMKGFYVKVGQLIATRVDLFPKQYSSELTYLVDSVNPLPFDVVRRTIEKELLEGYALEEVFAYVDPKPLGSASIAQVHQARLLNGKDIAIKVQRPNVEAQLLEDISLIKGLAKQLRGVFPVDYYEVFSELEGQLKEEFDFRQESSSMDYIATALSKDGPSPILVPRSIPGLVSRRVLCMDFMPGMSLAQLEKKGAGTGMDPKMVKYVGRKILTSLSQAFATMILEEGFFHADPHPGNIFIKPDGSVALIDFGQVKRIGYKFRREFAELVLLIADCKDTKEEYDVGIQLGKRMGLKFSETADELCPVALGMFVLDFSRTELPGGYSSYELSDRNVMKDVTYYPPEWVLTCRALQLIRGLAERLDMEFPLPKLWRKSALRALGRDEPGPSLVTPTAKGFWPRLKHWWKARAE